MRGVMWGEAAIDAPVCLRETRPGTGLSSAVSQFESGAGDEFELGIRKLQKAHTLLNAPGEAGWKCSA